MVDTEIIIAIIGATVGALLGSASSILFGLMMRRWQQKRDSVMALYDEYSTPEMIRARKLASAFMRKRAPGTGYYEYRQILHDQEEANPEYGNVTLEEFEGFRRLVLFFDRVYQFKDNGYLNRKLASGIIGIYLCGMAEDGWLDFLEDSPSAPGQTFHHQKHDILDLYDWFNCSKRLKTDAG